MNEEVLIPKMKRLEKKQRKIKIPLLNFVIVLFCTLLIIASTFININLKHYIIPSTIFSKDILSSADFICSFAIIPQIPILMFNCSVVGKRMAITSTILYIILGLVGLPIFALGGGIRYFAEFSFGYILAYIPALVIAGNLLNSKYSIKNILLAALFGTFTIHFLGMFYMAIIALLKHESSSFIFNWIGSQSGIKIIYDIILSFTLMLIGKYLHSALKFILE